MRRSIRLSAVFLIASTFPAGAVAQTTTSVGLQQYQPSPFSDHMLRLDGTGVAPAGELRIGLDLDYARRPLVLVDQAPGIFQAGAAGPNHNLVENAVGGALLASFALGHRLEAGLAVPLVLFQSGDAVPGVPKPSSAGVANPQVGIKAHLGAWRGLGAGLSLMASVPVGSGAFTHETTFGGTGRLFADYRRGPLTVGARAGLHLRKSQTFYDVPVGNQLDYAAGASLHLGLRTTVLAELAGLTAATKLFADSKQSPLEAMAGLRQRIGKLYLTLAAGPGLVHGYGSPIFRVVAGLTWASRPPDADGDGVSDDDDRCPTVPEDRDGFEDTDGCPDPDNDEDGIPDADDKCPNAAEDKDGFEDSDGCPDPDNDKDGIPDADDKCPNQPETKNGFEDEDGCPDELPPAGDRDGDGIPDEDDECPEEAEDKDGFEDEDGCPDLDNDKDGIPDALDKCPLEPETINGIDDDDGCPDTGPAQVRLGTTEIETLQPIFFDTDRSRVRHAFYSVLGQIALLMKAHPEIGRCAVEGHTDDTGPPEWNQKLSVLRAESVIEFLSGKGVDPKRLVAIGHAEKLPWASNETPWGRAKNRRVVFHIEGVDAAAEKKANDRAERRLRIRLKREAATKAPARSATEKATSPAETSNKPAADRPGAATAAAPDFPAAKPPATKATPNKSSPGGGGGSPAGAGEEKPRTQGGKDQDSAKGAPEKRPPNSVEGDQARAKAGSKAKGPPATPSEPAAAGKAVPEVPAESVDGGTSKAPERARRSPPRPPARRPADAGAERPATLQELLKLPPR